APPREWNRHHLPRPHDTCTPGRSCARTETPVHATLPDCRPHLRQGRMQPPLYLDKPQPAPPLPWTPKAAVAAAHRELPEPLSPTRALRAEARAALHPPCRSP